MVSGCSAGLYLMLGCSGMFEPHVGGVLQSSDLVWALTLPKQSSETALASKSKRSGAHTFEAIVIDWEEGAQAKSLAESISLRFPMPRSSYGDRVTKIWRHPL